MVDADRDHMRRALALARTAQKRDEIPIGAVVVHDGMIVGEGFNQPASTHDPSAHAEVIALRDAARCLKNYRLVDCSVYVSVEPCLMCVGAMVHARISRLVYGTCEPKSGAIVSRMDFKKLEFLNHTFEVTGGVLADESRVLLQEFFAKKRRGN